MRTLVLPNPSARRVPLKRYAAVLSLAAMLFAADPQAQSAAPGTYGVKVYRVDSSLYPYVQVYFRTFNELKQPLINLNELNIGLMVKGRSYDPMKRQYRVESIRQKQVGTRTV